MFYNISSMGHSVHGLALTSCFQNGYVIQVPFRSLAPSNTIGYHRPWPTLFPVKACHLLAPIDHLNDGSLIISKPLWHSTEVNFFGNLQNINWWETFATLHLTHKQLETWMHTQQCAQCSLNIHWVWWVAYMLHLQWTTLYLQNNIFFKWRSCFRVKILATFFSSQDVKHSH